MSAVATGNAGNVTTPLAATIVGMADNGSGLVRAQTSAPHLFGDQDYVHVVTTGTVINGYFQITVIDTTHFDLQGSTYTGTGTGTATDTSLTPAVQVPTDGDTFSLQLSGMLSSQQALLDRTQFLAKKIVQRTAVAVFVIATGSVVIPPWATHMLVVGCGGGGGGGGGMGGILGGVGSFQYASGGGGAGAEFGTAFASVLDATSLDVTIGAGGAGGAGSAGGASPSSANAGIHGDPSFVKYHDGSFAGIACAKFQGGSAGGGGGNEVVAETTTTPVFTPGGGSGPGGFFRNGGSKTSQYAPGFRQVYDLINTSGTISAAGAWATRVYTDPVGQMDYGEGGASMATAANGTYAAGVSFDGAPSSNGNPGGTAGTEGAADGVRIGGAAGGGGGGGGGGQGGNGGNGGAGSTGSGATNGTAGANAFSETGAGGGGGGGGGNGASGSAGSGGVGGNGGAGFIQIIFIAAPGTP